MSSPVHNFHAVAFVENITLKVVAGAVEDARRTVHELRYPPSGAPGAVFVYPFGAVVFQDVPPAARQAELARLRRAQPKLTDAQVGSEELTVREDPGATPEVTDGVLVVDRLTPERAAIVALTIAQSAAMEYYERIVEDMFVQTGTLVDRLEQRGTVSLKTRPLHRFIGAAIGTRSEVLSVLHLLDKPDATWDDAEMNRIYDELRAEFDLVDRFEALELKLRSVQEALELVLDVARDRRLVLLEVAIVMLIVMELVLSVAHKL